MNEIVLNNDLQITTERRLLRIIIFISLTIWCFGFTFASLLPKSEIIVLYPLVKQFYSSVCHQAAYKSIEMNGMNFLVCARCTGIYFGGLFSSILLLFFYKSYSLKVNHLFIAAVPMILDVIFYSSGIYRYSKITALSTGFLFGFVLVSFILSSIENFLLKRNNKDQ